MGLSYTNLKLIVLELPMQIKFNRIGVPKKDLKWPIGARSYLIFSENYAKFMKQVYKK